MQNHFLDRYAVQYLSAVICQKSVKTNKGIILKMLRRDIFHFWSQMKDMKVISTPQGIAQVYDSECTQGTK